MTRLEKVLLHGSAAGSVISGLAYAGFKHLMASDDPFSAVNHPLQPWALHAHVLASPALLFAVGMIFKDHVLGKLRNGAPPAARIAGGITLAAFVLLAASGYLIQVTISEPLRRWTAWTHLGLGVLFLIAYAGHLATVPSTSAARNGERTGAARDDPAPRGATVTGLRIGRRQREAS